MSTQRISRQRHAPVVHEPDRLLHVSPTLIVRVAWSCQRQRWVWLQELDELEDVSCDRPTTIANVLAEPLAVYVPRTPAARPRPQLLLPQLSPIEMLDVNYRRLRPGTRRSKVVARRLVHQRSSPERESFHRACWKAWRERLNTVLAEAIR